MGFFDKIKDALKRIKEDNKYMARTTARINSGNLYGWVNYKTGKMDPNDDFRAGSYVNVEDGKGIIYNTGDEDYVFVPGDIISFKHIGDGQPLNGGTDKVKELYSRLGDLQQNLKMAKRPIWTSTSRSLMLSSLFSNFNQQIQQHHNCSSCFLE